MAEREAVMKRVGLTLLSLFVASPAWGAEITRTLEAFEPTNPWDAQVEINYWRSLRRALVSREKPEASGTRFMDDKELRYSRVDHQMDFRFRFALYRDLEIFVNLPVVLSRSQFAGFALSGGDPGSVRTGGCSAPGSPTGDSTIVRDGLFRGGGIPSLPDPSQPQMDPASQRQPNRARTILGQAGISQPAACYLGQPGVPAAESIRSGFGDMSLGIAWAPLNNDRDETRPTWLLKLEYQMPTGTTMDPTPVDAARGDFRPRNDTAGLGMHALHFSTYLSKKIVRSVDPYIGFEYSALFPADNAAVFRRVSPNQEHVGPGQRAALVTGIEIVPWENRARQMKFAIDLRLRARLSFEGRDYSEIADFLGRATDIETYATIEAQLGFYVQITKWFLLRLHFGLGHDTKHFITYANIGEDRDGNGRVENNPVEQNPTYDPLTDQVGRRLSVGETTVFTWGFSLIAMF
jgi:hypothetical protein